MLYNIIINFFFDLPAPRVDKDLTPLLLPYWFGLPPICGWACLSNKQSDMSSLVYEVVTVLQIRHSIPVGSCLSLQGQQLKKQSLLLMVLV